MNLQVTGDEEQTSKIVQEVRNHLTPFGVDHPEVVAELNEVLK